MVRKDLRDEAVQRLKSIKGFDVEADHTQADEILCDLLLKLGYDEVVDAWSSINKWYA